MRKTMTGVGLMSGTSGDGVDAALVRFSGEKPEILATHYLPFDKRTRMEISAASRPDGRADLICSLNAKLGKIYGKAVAGLCESAGYDMRKVDFVGSHGQTIRHQPAASGGRVSSTLQIGEPAEIAAATGCGVVSGFREADIAAGGGGAPLAPLAHHAMFSDKKENRIVQNLGGISNVTWLAKGGKLHEVTGFDTGPANSLLDLAAARFSGGRLACDAGGRMALKGEVNGKLFARCMAHPYFRRVPPKSTGKETFGEELFERLFSAHGTLKKEDFLRTLAAVTAESAIGQVERFTRPGNGYRWIICGGGAKNRAIVEELRERLRGRAEVSTADEMGYPADHVEAVLMAILAFRTINGLPGNIPAVTGARRPAVLGKISLPPSTR